MARTREESGRAADSLRKGDMVAGRRLTQLISRDDFSSLWAGEPAEQGTSGGCVRAIPVRNLLTADAVRRFASELLFWRDLSNRCAVELFDAGQDGSYCYAVMRYMPEGSLKDQLGSARMAQEDVVSFAFALAEALRELHGTMGPHGNLKPSNVFPRPGGGVLLSDFALPLWADEYDRDPSGLDAKLLHAYRAPEQRGDMRTMDARSDVFAYALILVRCLTGDEPGQDGELPDMGKVNWPAGLWPVVQRCLDADPSARPADGYELCSVLSNTMREDSTAASEFETASDFTASSGLAAAHDTAGRLAEARALMLKGILEAAVDIVERLPVETEGVADLLDEIEARQRACEALVQEAVRLVDTGSRDAAMQAVAEAEQLWSGSETLAAVKEDLGRLAHRDEDIAGGRIPMALQDALEDERYPAARTQIESLMRQGTPSEEMARAVRRFKRGRVRKAFRENIAAARRLYVLGHRTEARDHWLEAANWLPPGPQRARLREIADAAGKGKLIVDVGMLGLADESEPDEVPLEAVPRPPRPAEDTQIVQEAQVVRARNTAVLVGLFVLMILMFIVLFWSLAAR